MKHHYFNRHLRRTLMAAVIAAPGLLFAGNIPQYTVSKGDKVVSLFSDGVTIPCSWTEGAFTIFPDGKEYANAHSGEGFPIGFDFRFGGQLFDQFVIENEGVVHFGKGTVETGDNSFQVNFRTMKNGLKAGAISYRTSGDEGNRVLEIQFKNAKIRETGYVGEYHLQFRFYESDGKIEMALQEINTTGTAFTGFDAGIHGWDGKDALQITANSLNPNAALSVSPFLSADMLEVDSYIRWNDQDFDRNYKPVYVFTPTPDTAAPVDAPNSFEVIQSGKNFLIECSKAENADATVILFSTEDFADSDYPVDGETFRGAYYDLDGNQHLPATFGNAKGLYYGNDERISVTLDNVIDGQNYYFIAMSANGYPNYGRAKVSKVSFTTSQAAPSSFAAEAVSKNQIHLSMNSEYPVIIASTNELIDGYMQGYTGVFGIPTTDVNIGDVIMGGGKVIYVGEAKDLTVDVESNSLTLFRAWSYNGTTLSATASDAAAVALPSYPYAPKVENYPIGESLMGWHAPQDQFVPWVKQYDGAKVLRAISIAGNEVALETPGLDLSLPMHISFEYSMETVRPANDQGVPMGNRPGDFGNGALKIKAGGETVKSVSTYNGTMTECPDGYESGSSTFDIVEFDIDTVGEDEKITFSFSTTETTYLYIRNIRITQIADAPKAPESAPTNTIADEDKSANLHFSCVKGEDAEYTLVLFSESPITEANYPEDGMVPAVGSRLGNAYVLYYGADETVECATTEDMVTAEFNTTYYFAALSASVNPLYNRENVAKVEYTTLKEVGKPKIEDPEFDEAGMALTVRGTRHADAASTVILISEGRFDGDLEDGRQYSHGDEVGNAKVIYHGTDETIEHRTDLVKPNRTYTLTAISANERGWWADTRSTKTFTTTMTGVEDVAAEASGMEIYSVTGVRIDADSVDELPSGLYIVNGRKIWRVGL